MRRRLLLLSVLLLLSLSAAAAAQYSEAPMLRELVEQGLLPPVEERLPANPYVVGPGDLIVEEHLDWQPGDYGGTLRMARAGPAFDPHVFIGSNQPLLWAPGAFYFERGIQGNVLEGFSVNEENTVFTFYMREGLRWSDGEYVTSEDVRFAFEDVMKNEYITPVFPAKYRLGGRADGEPMELEIIDEYTFEIRFPVSYGTFPARIAIEGWVGYTDLIKPAHYLRQYHADYSPIEDMQAELADEELEPDEWYRLFIIRNVNNWDLTVPKAIGFPTLYPWQLTSTEGGIYLYERNPYYFKVDTEGQQLPYMDRIVTEEVADFEMLTMKAMVGELDYLGERASLKSLPMFLDQEKVEDFKVVIPQMHRTPYTVFLNLAYDDPVWREVVGDVRFRQALNMAIDREEIIDMFYMGFAALPQTVPSEYDPEQAESILDAMGMAARDAEGWRLGPDGTRFTIHFDVASHDVDMVPITEMIVEYWQEIGVHTTYRQIESSLLGVRQGANEVQATAGWTHENIWRASGSEDFLPGPWGQIWRLWYNTGGQQGEEPPAVVKELFELHSQFVSSLIGSPENVAFMDEIYQLIHDNVLFMHVVENSSYPTILSTRLRNVPDRGQWNELGIILMYSPEQWYFAD